MELVLIDKLLLILWLFIGQQSAAFIEILKFLVLEYLLAWLLRF